MQVDALTRLLTRLTVMARFDMGRVEVRAQGLKRGMSSSALPRSMAFAKPEESGTSRNSFVIQEAAGSGCTGSHSQR